MKEESTSDRPAPPYSLGSVGFTRPIFQASSNTSRGKRPSRSQAGATGMMRSLVKRRAVSMRAFCSSVSSKSIMVLLACPLLPSRHVGAGGSGAEDVAQNDADEQDTGDEDDVLGGHSKFTPPSFPPRR